MRSNKHNCVPKEMTRVWMSAPKPLKQSARPSGNTGNASNNGICPVCMSNSVFNMYRSGNNITTMRSPHRDRLKPVPRPPKGGRIAPISTDCHRSDNPGSNCLFWLYLSSLLAVLRSPVRSFRLISSICSCTAQAGRGVREKKTRRAPALDDDVRRRGSSICAGVKKIQLVGNVGFWGSLPSGPSVCSGPDAVMFVYVLRILTCLYTVATKNVCTTRNTKQMNDYSIVQ